MELQKQIRDNAALRHSFNALAKKTFGISFEGWYQDGCWSDSYLPYALTEGDVVVANAAVNRMDFLWQGQVRRYIQIGTVMTDDRYRNRGLSRRLITEILHDWQARCDGVFLFANDTVLDFYPKFGVSAVQEFQHRKTVKQNRIGTAAARRLSLDDADDRRLFEHFSRKENPFAALQLLDRYGLTMFHSSFWTPYSSQSMTVVRCCAAISSAAAAMHSTTCSPPSCRRKQKRCASALRQRIRPAAWPNRFKTRIRPCLFWPERRTSLPIMR